jgi:hypothetical protein
MKVHFCQKNLPNRTFTHVQVISLHPPINPKTLHMGILVNAIIIDTVSFPQSVLCPNLFFTFAFLEMFWVHVIHVLDMFQVLMGM